MKNKKLIPFEVIEKAIAREPEAVDTVLRYYNAHIKYLSYYGFECTRFQHTWPALPCSARFERL